MNNKNQWVSYRYIEHNFDIDSSTTFISTHYIVNFKDNNEDYSSKNNTTSFAAPNKTGSMMNNDWINETKKFRSTMQEKFKLQKQPSKFRY